MGLKLIVLLFSLCSFVIQTDHPKQKQQKEKVLTTILSYIIVLELRDSDVHLCVLRFA